MAFSVRVASGRSADPDKRRYTEVECAVAFIFHDDHHLRKKIVHKSPECKPGICLIRSKLPSPARYDGTSLIKATMVPLASHDAYHVHFSQVGSIETSLKETILTVMRQGHPFPRYVFHLIKYKR